MKRIRRALYQFNNVAGQLSRAGVQAPSRTLDQIKREAAALQSFEVKLDEYLKANSLRYRHLAVTERLHPFDYRVMSSQRRRKPTPEWAIAKGNTRHFHHLVPV